MKITTYASSLAKRNKGKKPGQDVSVAQIAEVLKMMNEDSEGVLYALINGGVFVDGSNPDARDDNPRLTALKVLAKEL